MNIETIVDAGCCIGCGACAIKCENELKISFDDFGKYQADVLKNLDNQLQQKALSVCPFSDESKDEDQIGKLLFDGVLHDRRIGFFRSLYAGYVAEGAIREKATSGGIITWLLTELLATNKIDGVIHVKKTEAVGSGCLFEYTISRDATSVLAGAKSRYYPVEASKVLRHVRENPGRYAFVGIPCFVKAVRNLMLEEPVFAERIKYCIGIVCGHLKSKAFADYFGWQVGITPGALEEIDFRVKRDKGAAGDYAVQLKGDGLNITKRTQEFIGSNWGHNFFRYEACDYCDDVLAETADIAVGDAWLPKYDVDPKGTCIVVVRSEELADLISVASENGRLHLDPTTADNIALSQAGGLRDRREGLAYRLSLKEKAGEWVPRKRIKPSSKELSPNRKKIYEHRSYMAKMSHILWKEAVNRNSLRYFENSMLKLIKKSDRLYKPYWKRLQNKLKYFLKN